MEGYRPLFYVQTATNFCQRKRKWETLLLIHGFPTASWDWYRMWPDLVQEYHVLAADFLGFGFSDKPRNYPYSILDQADLLEALLREKGIGRVHIISHDYGDTVAQELLARFSRTYTKGETGVNISSFVYSTADSSRKYIALCWCKKY